MKLEGFDLDELYREAAASPEENPGRVGKVLAIVKDAGSEEGKPPETVAAIKALKKLVPATLATAALAIALVVASVVYTIWGALHGSHAGGAPLIAGAIAVGLAILGVYYAIARRTFGKPWYEFRDSIGL